MSAPDRLLAQALGLHDPAAGLEAVRELREHLARLEAIHVENALRSGWRWSDVASGLGLSKQAAHRKYAATMRERLAHADAAPEGERRVVVSAPARLAVMLARQEADAMRRAAVGTEHVLLGLTRLEGSRAAGALAAVGATPEATRTAVDAIGPEPALAAEATRRLPLTPTCATALRRALRDAADHGE